MNFRLFLGVPLALGTAAVLHAQNATTTTTTQAPCRRRPR